MPGEGARSGAPRAPLSLKGRALRYLSRREHSRLELQRKLAAHAESPEQLARVLDELESALLLSNERFAESLAHRKAPGFGTALIRHQLRAHAIDPAVIHTQVAALGVSELTRARALWTRRFGAPAATAQERAKQARFLLARGFSPEIVRKLVRGFDGAPED